jgi:hypothetical protein
LDSDCVVVLIAIVGSLHDCDALFPYHVFVDCIVLELEASRDILNRETWLEEQQRYALHHFDRIYLILE